MPEKSPYKSGVYFLHNKLNGKVYGVTAMRIACVYWYTSSVGGIATHLNSLRTAAIKAGDTFDILHSRDWSKKVPQKFHERQWVRGGDTRIWIDGEVPQNEEGRDWLQANYDAVLFGFICPHQTKAYPQPTFLPLYDVTLPKVAWVMDGYWDDYSEWAIPLIPKLNGILCPLESYATPLRKLGVDNLKISAFPFVPYVGRWATRSTKPSMMWPCQWKNIKGIKQFLSIVPELTDMDVAVNLYSCGIEYYQLRTEPVWKAAVGQDEFLGFHGEGKATYYGNVDMTQVIDALQRAWFTCNLQGMKTRKETYRRGSYNNTEVEALWYGACPILHSSTSQTALPEGTYLPVDCAEEIPATVQYAVSTGYALSPRRQDMAREFVSDTHMASHRYRDVKEMF